MADTESLITKWEASGNTTQTIAARIARKIAGKNRYDEPPLNSALAAARGIGRAANGAAPVVSELCGQCGKGRAAIGMDGQLTPCVLGRFLIAGNVKDTPLGDLFAGDAWREILTAVPKRNDNVCSPADGSDCDLSKMPA